MPIFLLFFALLFHCSFSYAEKPALTLAKTYQGDIDINQYWVSEKLDGVRAYWDGKKFISRQGNLYHAPHWFIQQFPKTPLDGELWLARGKFEKLLSIVRKKCPIDQEWKTVHYFVFDLPQSKLIFTDRLNLLKNIVKQADSPYLQIIKQYKLTDHSTLMSQLNHIVSLGGEGLMLHHENALYRPGRNTDVLKVKRYMDAEAIVIAHTKGKGKFTGLLGALLVKTTDDIQFKIGSGFNLEQRKNPPVVGAVVTYRYHGKTQNGIPRFASFLRIRK